jgi:hypothetical protein
VELSWNVLREWHEFYTMAGSAAATLMGLLCVALSLRGHRSVATLEKERGVWLLAQVAFTSFLDILLITLPLLMARPQPSELGLLLLALGFLAIGVTVASGARMHNELPHLHGLKNKRTIWTVVLLPVVCYLVQIVAAIMIIERLAVGLHWLVLVVMLLLVIAAYTSWNLLRSLVLDQIAVGE